MISYDNFSVANPPMLTIMALSKAIAQKIAAR